MALYTDCVRVLMKHQRESLGRQILLLDYQILSQMSGEGSESGKSPHGKLSNFLYLQAFSSDI